MHRLFLCTFRNDVFSFKSENKSKTLKTVLVVYHPCNPPIMNFQPHPQPQQQNLYPFQQHNRNNQPQQPRGEGIINQSCGSSSVIPDGNNATVFSFGSNGDRVGWDFSGASNASSWNFVAASAGDHRRERVGTHNVQSKPLEEKICHGNKQLFYQNLCVGDGCQKSQEELRFEDQYKQVSAPGNAKQQQTLLTQSNALETALNAKRVALHGEMAELEEDKRALLKTIALMEQQAIAMEQEHEHEQEQVHLKFIEEDNENEPHLQVQSSNDNRGWGWTGNSRSITSAGEEKLEHEETDLESVLLQRVQHLERLILTQHHQQSTATPQKSAMATAAPIVIGLMIGFLIGRGCRWSDDKI